MDEYLIKKLNLQEETIQQLLGRIDVLEASSSQRNEYGELVLKYGPWVSKTKVCEILKVSKSDVDSYINQFGIRKHKFGEYYRFLLQDVVYAMPKKQRRDEEKTLRKPHEPVGASLGVFTPLPKFGGD